MDDPHPIPSLSFPTLLPLPFRVVFLISAGILAWASNLHGLQRAGIDVFDLFDVPRGPDSLSYANVYRLYVIFAVWAGGCWSLFFLLTRGDNELLDTYSSIPALCLIFMLGALVAPFNVLCKRERRQFLRAIHRCLSSRGKPSFSDIILADILTSFAKVLGDIWISLLMFLPGGSLVRGNLLSQQLDWLVPLIMSIPYLIRFRQCIMEYMDGSEGRSASLYNALKYLSAFPVIFLSSMQRKVAADVTGSETSGAVWFGEHPMFRLWLLSVVVNSIYSFWWDTCNDWGLNILRSRPTTDSDTLLVKTRSPYPRLRSTLLLFSGPLPYTVATIMNLILRLTWSLKLSPHLHSVADLEYGVFLLEGLEVFRRWLWVYFRVEWEYIKRLQQHPLSPRPHEEQIDMDSISIT